MSKHKNRHKHNKSFLSSVGYYILIAILIVCLAFMVKVNRTKKAERDEYKETLSKEETVEDLGNISITKPTDAPDDAAIRTVENAEDEEDQEQSDDKKSDSDKTDKVN